MDTLLLLLPFTPWKKKLKTLSLLFFWLTLTFPVKPPRIWFGVGQAPFLREKECPNSTFLNSCELWPIPKESSWDPGWLGEAQLHCLRQSAHFHQLKHYFVVLRSCSTEGRFIPFVPDPLLSQGLNSWAKGAEPFWEGNPGLWECCGCWWREPGSALPALFQEKQQQPGCDCSLLSISASPSWQLFNSLHLSGSEIAVLIKTICFKWGSQIPAWCFRSLGRRAGNGEQRLLGGCRVRLEGGIGIFVLFLRPGLAVGEIKLSRTEILSSQH